MTRSRTVLPILLVLFGLAVAGCGGDDGEGTAAATTEAGGSAGGNVLTGSVGPGFDIGLSGADGLAAGSYTLTVNDRSSAHNFHLTGPGVDISTDVGGEGEESFEVQLVAGEYTYVCDPHASQMRGTFTVG